jgi:2-polyprenyl-3-methyl-5-hydroxy-6-metoxy-1,4-benzoquinol methylase
MKRRLLRLGQRPLQSRAAEKAVTLGVRLWMAAVTRLPADEALRRLLRLDERLQQRVDGLAIELDGGVHAKHRLIGYHEFFVGHVSVGERVLDVGSGKGELAYDLATRAGASVTGLDFNPVVLRFARSRFSADGLEFVEGDVLTWVPPQPYDTVVLSNVLEHIAPRVELLRRLRDVTAAGRFLIRVPSRERDWLVPLRAELGLAHYSDPTHETEYTVAQLHEELADAGLVVEQLEQRWGELWAVAGPPKARAILDR